MYNLNDEPLRPSDLVWSSSLPSVVPESGKPGRTTASLLINAAARRLSTHNKAAFHPPAHLKISKEFHVVTTGGEDSRGVTAVLRRTKRVLENSSKIYTLWEREKRAQIMTQ